MKILTIAALLAVSLFAAAPAAHAADWNNDTLSCDIKVETTWLGQWLRFQATFYLPARPKTYCNYTCVWTEGRNKYTCIANGFAYVGDWDWNKTSQGSDDLVFNPGITQRQTCEILFNKFHPTPK